MAFDVLDQNVSQLFKNDDIFCVPRYQRNYVWKELNWSQLIKDIRYCAEITPDWSHFIGSMVFERKEKSGGLVDIIDGQQRIVTLQIVIFALIYCYHNIKITSKDENVIRQCEGNIVYLQDLITNRTLGKAQTIKVENGYQEFVDLNQSLLDLDDNFIDKYESLIIEPKKVKSVILQAFIFFVRDFSTQDFCKLAALTRQFLAMRVVTISSMQEEEVYNIFEILNARGVKLKQVELLKNYLFKYLKPKSLLDTYKQKWSELELTLDGIDLDDYYLHVFRCWHYKNKLGKDQLFEVTKDQLRKGELGDLSIFFDFFIECCRYYRMINDAEGDLVEAEIYEYFKLKRNKQIRSVFLALKIKKQGEIIDEKIYNGLLVLLRNFYVIFNLDNGRSNQIDNDIYMLSHDIFRSKESYRIEYAVLKFLNKFSVYFQKQNVLEDGLRHLIYSNKSARKNISSKLLVYFFRPLLMKDENQYVQYDFSTFNVEHILNDDYEEEIRFSLGNLLLCPKKLNSDMRNLPYSEKRKLLLDSQIPYLENFGQKYEQFDETCIASRSAEIISYLKKTYLISKKDLDDRILKIEIYISLKQQLEIAFGKDSQYVSVLKSRGVDNFIQFIYKNGALPKDDVQKIVTIISKIA